MLKAYHSDYLEVGRNPHGVWSVPPMSNDQLIKYALGQVLKYMGLRMQFEAARNEVDIPVSIRVESKIEGWDIQVRLYPERKEEDAVSRPLSDT